MSRLNVDNPLFKVLREPSTGVIEPEKLGLFINGVTPENIKEVPKLLTNKAQLEAMVEALHKSPNLEEYNTTHLGVESYYPDDVPKVRVKRNEDILALRRIFKMQHLIKRFTNHKKAVEYYDALGFKNTALNCKLAKLDTAIGYFNSIFGIEDPVNRKLNNILYSLSYAHGMVLKNEYPPHYTECMKVTAVRSYKESVAVIEHFSQAIKDYLYFTDRQNAPDSFVKQYLSAMSTVEEGFRKEFKILEPSAPSLFVKTLQEMIKRNKAKNIKPLSKEELSEVFKRHEPIIKKMYEPIIAREKNLKDFEKYCSMEHHDGYIHFCLRLHDAGVIDGKTFEDMAFKSVYRKKELEEHLYKQEAFIKVREADAFTGYAAEGKLKTVTHALPIFLKRFYSKVAEKFNNR
jgi:hypothetical protein